MEEIIFFLDLWCKFETSLNYASQPSLYIVSLTAHISLIFMLIIYYIII